ncbi:MAG: DUF4412 domain-containing protein [Gelidibacter sp.]|nr:DUF4412 domain-containing protein [Gelidibacter sp.]
MSFKFFKTATICLTLCFISQQSFSQFPKSKKADLPETYMFDYSYKLKMTSKKGDMVLNYYLKKGADYFGYKMDQMEGEQGDMIFVMDKKLNVNVMLMNMAGQKMLQTTSMNMNEIVSDASETNKDFTMKKIGTKTIMGYECQGFMSESDEHEITFYIAEKAPVSFNNMWTANAKNMPKGFDSAWMEKFKNGLMMEMIYKDKKKSKNDMTMTCVELRKTNFSIKTTDYKSFGG